MPGRPPESTNVPDAFVPPVPSTLSAPVHGGVLGMDGTAAMQISMQVFGVGRGAPVPFTRIEPVSTPPVITGAPGTGVMLGVADKVCVGVALAVPLDTTVSAVEPITPPNVAPIELIPGATAVANPPLVIVATDGVPDAQVT